MSWPLAAPLLALCMGVTSLPARAATLDDYSDEQIRALQTDLASSYLTKGHLGLPEIDFYISRLVDALGSRLRIFATIDKSRTINAAAYWGNIIALNAGMFDFVRSEEELMGVLAHEVSHISEKHFTRLADKQKLIDIMTGTAFLLGALSGNSELGKAVISGSLGIRANRTIAQIRTLEYEADSIAFDMLAKSSINPAGYADMMRRLDSAATDAHEYLLSHPLPRKRLSQLRARLRQSDLLRTTRPQLNFFLARELVRFKLRAPQTTPPPDTSAGKIAADYALLLRENGDATEVAKRLLPHSGNWMIALALAEFFEHISNATKAHDLLAEVLATNPGNWVVATRLLNMLTNAGNYEQGRELLAKVSREIAANHHFALAEAKFWHATQNMLSYRLALTQAYYLGGRLVDAERQSLISRQEAKKGNDSLALAGLDSIDNKIRSLRELITRTQF